MLKIKVMELVADLADSEWISWKAPEWDSLKGNLQVHNCGVRVLLEFKVPRVLLDNVPSCRTSGKPEEDLLSMEIGETVGGIRTVRMIIPRTVSESDYIWIMPHLETIRRNNIILAADMYREFKTRYADTLPKKREVRPVVVDDDDDEW